MTNARKEPFLSFKRLLGFMPNNLELYEIAVRHRSASIRNDKKELINNERLEFLGDAVLNSIISDKLFHYYKDEKEGFLTNARSNIVNRELLNNICCQIGLDRLIISDRKLIQKKNSNIFGNTLEALIGAVYLDVGYKKCSKFVEKHLLVSPEWMEELARENKNHKSEILEWCQQHHLTLDFVVVEEKINEDNLHTFISQVQIENTVICTGYGASKKESQQQASHQAMKLMKEDKNFLDRFHLNTKKTSEH